MTQRSNNLHQRVNLIQGISVSLLLTFSPQTVLKKVLFMSCRAYSVGLILISFPFIGIPLISLFFLIFSANTSMHRIRMQGESGQPCLTPLLCAKKLPALQCFLGHSFLYCAGKV